MATRSEINAQKAKIAALWQELEDIQRSNRERANKAEQALIKRAFWDEWIEACKPPVNLMRQVIAVTARVNSFAWYTYNQDMRDHFWMELIGRCIAKYEDFDSSRSSFVTWVCWNATSLAGSIISSRADSPRGPIGRGVKWPYNADMEPTFTDLEPVDDGSFEWDSFDWMVAPESDEFLDEVQNWIQGEIKLSADVGKVYDVIAEASQTPSVVSLSRQTGLSQNRITAILGNLRHSFLMRFRDEA